MTLTLVFKLAEEVYGLEVYSIQEIVEDPELHYAPWADGVLTGAVNFHGQILAVIDLPELLGFTCAQRDHRYVVLTADDKPMVFLVSRVERIVQLDLSVIELPPADKENRAIRGIVDHEGVVVNLLDTNNVIEKLERTFA